MSRSIGPAKNNPTPLEDRTPDRVYHEYDFPIVSVLRAAAEDPEAFEVDDEWMIADGDARTADFGVVATVGLKLLTPLEEKAAAARSKENVMIMALELTKASVAFTVDVDGTKRVLRAAEGDSDLLFAQLHPKLRSMIVQAYSDSATPRARATSSFLKSRRIRA